jgi:RNA polymerase sigma-70 factor (ECF subfamily)
MYQFAYSRIRDHEMAKDMVQETFLAALKAMSNFQGKSNERTWLTAILKRKVIDYYRKINSVKGKAEISMSFYQDGEKKGEWLEEKVPQSWKNDAESTMESDELRQAIELCIDYLPEKYAMVFTMRTLQQMETEEICKELGITSSNLWVMIHRARTQLRRCLEDNWFNSEN